MTSGVKDFAGQVLNIGDYAVWAEPKTKRGKLRMCRVLNFTPNSNVSVVIFEDIYRYKKTVSPRNLIKCGEIKELEI